jgi:transcriptional regulator with XRE-family HTH domain
MQPPKENIFDFSVVKNLRAKLGMTADELARKANLTRVSISNIERGNSNPTMGTVKALADVFQLAPSELVHLAEKARCEEPAIRTFEIGKWEGLHSVFPGFQIYRAFGRAGAESVFDPAIHENTLEIAYVLAGRIRVIFRERSYELTANMSLRFKALHEHTVIAMENTELLMIMHSLVQ